MNLSASSLTTYFLLFGAIFFLLLTVFEDPSSRWANATLALVSMILSFGIVVLIFRKKPEGPK